jgi:DNA-binding MarR family transcriptional regulator
MLTSVLETSIDSYHAHQGSGKTKAQQQWILDVIETHGGDWSIGELAKLMGLEKSTVSARVNELVTAKELEERPKRKDRVSEILVRPVGLPTKQAGLFQ